MMSSYRLTADDADCSDWGEKISKLLTSAEAPELAATNFLKSCRPSPRQWERFMQYVNMPAQRVEWFQAACVKQQVAHMKQESSTSIRDGVPAGVIATIKALRHSGRLHEFDGKKTAQLEYTTSENLSNAMKDVVDSIKKFPNCSTSVSFMQSTPASRDARNLRPPTKRRAIDKTFTDDAGAAAKEEEKEEESDSSKKQDQYDGDSNILTSVHYFRQARESTSTATVDEDANETLVWISSATTQMMEWFLAKLDVKTLTDTQITCLFESMAHPSVKLSYANSEIFMNMVVAPFISGLSGNVSRAFERSSCQFGKLYSKVLAKHVIKPVADDPSLSSHQRNLLVKLVLECFDADGIAAVMSSVAETNNSTNLDDMLSQSTQNIEMSGWNDEKIMLVSSLLKKCGVLSSVHLERLCSALLVQSEQSKANLKFAQLVLLLFSKSGRALVPRLEDMKIIAERNTTFMKRSLISAISKVEKAAKR